MTEILIVGNGQSKTVEVEAVPKVGERVRIWGTGKTIVDGIVIEVEHFYSPTFNEITVKVK